MIFTIVKVFHSGSCMIGISRFRGLVNSLSFDGLSLDLGRIIRYFFFIQDATLFDHLVHVVICIAVGADSPIFRYFWKYLIISCLKAVITEKFWQSDYLLSSTIAVEAEVLVWFTRFHAPFRHLYHLPTHIHLMQNFAKNISGWLDWLHFLWNGVFDDR